MTIQTYRHLEPVSTTFDLGAGVTGSLKASTSFLDYDGVTNTIGYVLSSKTGDCAAQLARDTSKTISTVTTVDARRGFKQVTTSTAHGITAVGSRVAFTNATGTLAWTSVTKIVSTTAFQVRVNSYQKIEQATTINYPIMSYNIGVELGLMNLVLGEAPASAEKVRVAIVCTNSNLTEGSPNVTYQDLVDDTETDIVWHRLYDVGSQVNIDFGGLRVVLPHLTPYNLSTEKRIMLCFFSEAGTAAAISDVELEMTYYSLNVIDYDK